MKILIDSSRLIDNEEDENVLYTNTNDIHSIPYDIETRNEALAEWLYCQVVDNDIDLVLTEHPAIAEALVDMGVRATIIPEFGKNH